MAVHAGPLPPRRGSTATEIRGARADGLLPPALSSKGSKGGEGGPRSSLDTHPSTLYVPRMRPETISPNPWMMLPFCALLAAIALGPLCFAKWWAKHYPKVAFSLAALTVGYYLFGLPACASVFGVGHHY